MAQTMTPKLDVGDSFPEMMISLVAGRTLMLPDDLNTAYIVFLGYRGKW